MSGPFQFPGAVYPPVGFPLPPAYFPPAVGFSAPPPGFPPAFPIASFPAAPAPAPAASAAAAQPTHPIAFPAPLPFPYPSFPVVPGSARPVDLSVTVPEVVMETITVTRKVPKQTTETVEISFQVPVYETRVKTIKKPVTKMVDQDITLGVTKTFQFLKAGPTYEVPMPEPAQAQQPPAGYVHKPPADDTIST